ncbi:MAG: hypothetical protein J7J98_07160, partial [candidate division Zixibacteria bacterium]|nr:hypothetical protein [candidate division Zixibacteria bacterium]
KIYKLDYEREGFRINLGRSHNSIAVVAACRIMRAPGGGDRAVSTDISVRPRVAGITRGGTAGLRSGA